MKRVRITRKSRAPLLFSLDVIVDGTKVARLRYGESKVVEFASSSEIIQIGLRGAISVQHQLYGIKNGDHLAISKCHQTRGSIFVLPYEFTIVSENAAL